MTGPHGPDRDHAAWLGAGSGDIGEAIDFAREIAIDFQRRVVVRLDGGRTPVDSPGRANALLWTVYDRAAEETR